MRKPFIAAALALLMTGTAASAMTVTGDITAINKNTREITLNDGSSYKFQPKDFFKMTSGFRVGNTVEIIWAPFGGYREAHDIGSVHGFSATGTIAAIDAQAGTVTLKDGATYDFSAAPTSTDSNPKAALTGYRVGDAVRVVYAADGASGLALSGNPDNTVIGVIASTDHANQTVTLENGTTYAVDYNEHNHNLLGGFLPGEKVRLVVGSNGTATVIEDIRAM